MMTGGTTISGNDMLEARHRADDTSGHGHIFAARQTEHLVSQGVQKLRRQGQMAGVFRAFTLWFHQTWLTGKSPMNEGFNWKISYK